MIFFSRLGLSLKEIQTINDNDETHQNSVVGQSLAKPRKKKAGFAKKFGKP